MSDTPITVPADEPVTPPTGGSWIFDPATGQLVREGGTGPAEPEFTHTPPAQED